MNGFTNSNLAEFPSHVSSNVDQQEQGQQSSRKELLSASYEQQGITLQAVQECLDTALAIVTDPKSLVNKCYQKMGEIRSQADAERPVCYALFEVYEKLKEEYEELCKLNKDKAAIDRQLQEMQQARDAYKVKERQIRYFGDQINALQERIEKYDSASFPHTESFYCTTSDNLPVVREKVDVKGKKVATVASNGDFWQIFTEQGASEIKIFDVSIPALMYNELKLVALNALDFEEYKALFCHDSLGENSFSEERYSLFFNESLYQKIRDQLTPQAQSYYDKLLKMPNVKALLFNNWDGFVRIRRNDLFIGDIIKDEFEYEMLRKKSRQVKYELLLCDVLDADQGTRLLESQVIYLSNIGYRLDTSFKLGRRLIEGTERKAVISTSNSRVQQSELPKRVLPLTSDMELSDGSGLHIKTLGVEESRKDGGIILELTFE